MGTPRIYEGIDNGVDRKIVLTLTRVFLYRSVYEVVSTSVSVCCVLLYVSVSEFVIALENMGTVPSKLSVPYSRSLLLSVKPIRIITRLK